MKRPLATYCCSLSDCEHILEYRLRESPGGNMLRIREYDDGVPGAEHQVPVSLDTNRWILAEMARHGAYSPGAGRIVTPLSSLRRISTEPAPVAVACIRHREKLHCELVYCVHRRLSERMSVGISLIEDEKCVEQRTQTISVNESTAIELMLICAQHFVFPGALEELIQDLEHYAPAIRQQAKARLARNRKYVQT